MNQIHVEMSKMKEFLIQFAGLKLGRHQFEFQVDDEFFKEFGYDEFQNSNIKVSLVFEKQTTLLELNFKHKGTVNVPCDVSGEDFDLPIKGKMKLIVRFGDEFNDENEELLILPHGEHEVNVSQYVYEMIALSVPHKRIHPGLKDGTLQSPTVEKLQELEVKVKEEESKNEADIDPRWEKLKQLLTDK